MRPVLPAALDFVHLLTSTANAFKPQDFGALPDFPFAFISLGAQNVLIRFPAVSCRTLFSFQEG